MIEKIKQAKVNEQLVIFAGAGISKYLGLPDWKQLITAAYEEISRTNKSKASLIPGIESNELPLITALDLIKEHKKDVYSLLKKLIDVELQDPLLHKKLWRISRKVITTNYDRAFEKSNPTVNAVIQGYNYELATLKDQRQFLFKIHGTIEHAEGCVLFTEDFDKIYTTDSLIKDVLKDTIIHNTFLFVGFSMGDPFIKKIFHHINSLYNGYLQKHYLISVDDLDLIEFGIQTLRISNYNEGFNDFLDQIANDTDLQAVSSINTPAPNKSKFSILPKSSRTFTGRKNELEEFSRVYKLYNFLSVEGLGGIGKTQFVTKFIENLSTDQVIWFDCIEDSQFEALIETAGYTFLLNSDKQPLFGIFLGFTELIEKDKKIIILDNYHDLKDSRFREFIVFLKNNLTNCKIILLSRTKVAIENIDIYHLLLTGLQDDSLEFAKKIVTHYSGIQISDNHLNSICIELNGHPFAIQLAIQLLSYEESTNSIFDIIGEYHDEKEKLSNRLLSEVFNHKKSSDSERLLLTAFSVFRIPVPIKAIEFVYGSDFRGPLKKLIDKLIIEKNGKSYYLHSLVRQFAYEKIDTKKELHKKAAEYFKTIDHLSIAEYEELFFHLEQADEFSEMLKIIERDGERIMNHGYYKFLKDKAQIVITNGAQSARLYNFLTDLAFIVDSDAEAAIEFSKKALALNSNDIEANLEAKIGHAEGLLLKMQLENPIKSFRKYYNESLEANFRKGESICLAYIGKLLFEKSSEYYQEGEKKIKQGLDIATEINYAAGVNLCLSFLATHYLIRGTLKKAYECFDKINTYFSNLGNQRLVYKAKNGFAVVLSSNKKYTEAIPIFKECIEFAKKSGDKFNEGISSLNLADCLWHTERNNSYEKFAEAALDVFDNIKAYDQIFYVRSFLAETYEKRGLYAKALKESLKGVVLVNKYKFEDPFTIMLTTIKNKIGIMAYQDLYAEELEKFSEDDKKIIVSLNVAFRPTITSNKIGRNDPCPCESGKKYKSCCGKS